MGGRGFPWAAVEKGMVHFRPPLLPTMGATPFVLLAREPCREGVMLLGTGWVGDRGLENSNWEEGVLALLSIPEAKEF